MTHNTSDNQTCGVWNDQMATWYVEKWGEHPMHDQVVSLAQPSKEMTILDIGCGSGPVVRRFAAYLEKGHVIGIDPTAKMIELAKQQTDEESLNVPVSFKQAGAESLPCDDNSIDLVVAVNSLHHWQEVPHSLQEIRRVLKPAGKLVVIDELWDEMPEFEKPQDMACEDMSAVAEHIEQYKNLDVVMKALTDAGFKNLSRQTHRSEDVAVSVLAVTN